MHWIIVSAGAGVLVAAIVVWTGPRWLVASIARDAPGCLYTVPTRERAVALTIDDGPSTNTAEILRVLREHGAHATFFLVSSNVPRREGVVNAIVSEGHELGNHMTHDEPSIRLTPEAFERSMREAGDTIGRFGTVRWLRPGGGWYTARMVAAIERAGYHCALGSVYPFDAQLPASGLASAFVLANTRPGAVIVLHDGVARGRRTVATLERVLPELRRRRLRVVSLSELERLGSRPSPD